MSGKSHNGRCPACGIPYSKRPRGWKALDARGRIAFLRRRDGNACAICGLLVPDVDAREGHREKNPLGPTTEHRNPKARKGCACDANCALAHRFCNQRRGDRELTPDLVRQIRQEFLIKLIARALGTMERGPQGGYDCPMDEHALVWLHLLRHVERGPRRCWFCPGGPKRKKHRRGRKRRAGKARKMATSDRSRPVTI